jgi:hypothetical protein
MRGNVIDVVTKVNLINWILNDYCCLGIGWVVAAMASIELIIYTELLSPQPGGLAERIVVRLARQRLLITPYTQQ